MIMVAREIVGGHGEPRGIHCPHCGGREYPIGRGGTYAKCTYCGEVYELPPCYFFNPYTSRYTRGENYDTIELILGGRIKWRK